MLAASVTAAVVTAPGFVTRIPFAPLPLVVFAALAAGYFGATRKLRARGDSWPATRSAAWYFGVAVGAFAMCSGLASWDGTSLGVHGVIDMLVGLVAPVFLALGAPFTLASSVAGDPLRVDRLARGRLLRTLTYPAVAYMLFAASLFAQYFTPFFATGRHHEILLQVGHLELLAAGFLYVLPAIGADPFARRYHPGRRIIYVLLGMVIYTFFGMGLESRTSSPLAGVPVSGVHTAGDIIWSAGIVLAISASVAMLYQWLFSDLAQARAEDEADAEELALQASLWRVSRLLAKPEDVKEAERQAVLRRETIAASSRRRGARNA